MIRTRIEKERREREWLASYAQKSGDSAGRVHVEPKHPHRTVYERDRSRIIHSRAFRRLEYKTQVFLNGTGDHLRTRLTHTIEVASISRTIARALGLNEDLAEAIALAHDLGHAPFGHSGETVLNELMRGHGGFEHNVQNLRIVEVIERKYPRFAGLNLSWEVREGLQKHQKFYDPPERGLHEKYMSPSLEAQIANLADEITYYSHDLDDGLDFQLITARQLEELEVWCDSYAEVRRHFPKLRGKELHSYVIRCIIDRQVQDVVTTSEEFIHAAGVRSANDVRRQKKPLIRYSLPLLKANQALRKFLYKNLYFHPRVATANDRACELLKNVFERYLKKPSLLGETTAKRVRKDGLHRTVCDYLSGMTDRYLIEEHGRLFDEEKESSPVRRRLDLGRKRRNE
ncbi:deoxyguanosinetriphosphate triphosphohydrolase [Chthoniobacter flavus Ellin428]|uniref:Deoxyguanosinetriphosphate triphosphohydrolase-like protein n=1 Tax=Chthoniobacter flavus Ellin428 TaxID=497964 RepID=B4D8Y3_9BACT|nr:deoxyguanosinetriphosphate triphosphohydrolase [Chthoniobacter flavus]EDY17028.1 deoxyguanosinetriphosphate triphosphohydrolase [Chthoniobacter flavus Ellin428]TCO86205.1 dGTPase [Chthoniobacter flavus]